MTRPSASRFSRISSRMRSLVAFFRRQVRLVEMFSVSTDATKPSRASISSRERQARRQRRFGSCTVDGNGALTGQLTAEAIAAARTFLDELFRTRGRRGPQRCGWAGAAGDRDACARGSRCGHCAAARRRGEHVHQDPMRTRIGALVPDATDRAWTWAAVQGPYCGGADAGHRSSRWHSGRHARWTRVIVTSYGRAPRGAPPSVLAYLDVPRDSQR